MNHRVLYNVLCYCESIIQVLDAVYESRIDLAIGDKSNKYILRLTFSQISSYVSLRFMEKKSYRG